MEKHRRRGPRDMGEKIEIVVKVDPKTVVEGLSGEELFEACMEDQRQADDFIVGYSEHYGIDAMIQALSSEFSYTDFANDLSLRDPDSFGKLAVGILGKLDMSKLKQHLIEAESLTEFLDELGGSQLVDHMSQRPDDLVSETLGALTARKDVILNMADTTRFRLIERLSVTYED